MKFLCICNENIEYGNVIILGIYFLSLTILDRVDLNIYFFMQNIDVLYYIGDTIDHGVWETSYDLINEMNLYVIDKIRKTLGDNVLVIPVIGNHESQPTNQ